MKIKKTNIIMDNKIFIWIAGAIAAILSIPLIMMQVSSDWDWGLADFIIMGGLMFFAACLFVFLARKNPKYKVFIGVALAIAFILVWIHLAVGIIDSAPFAGS